jgi:thiamine-phosphate pyrophosphorylase
LKVDFNIYLVTDRNQTDGRPLEAVVESSLRGGIRAVQLREKGIGDRELFSLAKNLRSMTRRLGAKLFINDRLDIALAVNADGIHLGQESISPGDARKYFGGNRMIGVSTHSLDEAVRAENEGADFITFGPIYDTPSKRRYGAPLGLHELEIVAKKVKISLFAIGGIKKAAIGDVVNAGAYGIALVSAILTAKEPEAVARALADEIRKCKGI